MEAKQRILAAAEEVIAQKGLVKSNISEIAQAAGVVDSLIYQHFNGKLDLLFSVTAMRIKEIMSLLDEQLKGIRDAESLLSKMIWFHMHYNLTHKGYIWSLLFECRSNPEFYETEAYKDARKYAGIMLGILEKGVNDGVFSDKLNMRIVREIIFGGLDLKDLIYLSIGEPDNRNGSDDVIDLILFMIRKTPDQKSDPNAGEKRKRIMASAEKVFAKEGFARARIVEIAKLSGVSEGSIYEHFKSKEDLLFSIPNDMFRRLRGSLGETFEIRTPLRKLRRLIRYHFSMFLINRDVLKIFLRNILTNPNFYRSEAYEDFKIYLATVEDVIREGIAEGVFREEINLRMFAIFFMGGFYHMALRWFIVEESKMTDKMSEIDEFVDLMCRAVLKA